MRNSNSKILQEIYLEFVNDFLTVARFAEYHGLTEDEAAALIVLSKQVHERLVANSLSDTHNSL